MMLVLAFLVEVVDRVTPCRPGSAPRPRLAAALAVIVTVAVASPAAAASRLENAAVEPTSAVAGTPITFTVEYVSESPRRDATRVWIEAEPANGGAAVTVDLALETGTLDDGTWTGFSTLAPGTWTVSFRAEAAPPASVAAVPYGEPIVVAGPSSSPTPTPDPSTPPSPSPGPPSPEPTATPRTPTPRPSPIATSGSPRPTADETPREDEQPGVPASPAGSVEPTVTNSAGTSPTPESPPTPHASVEVPDPTDRWPGSSEAPSGSPDASPSGPSESGFRPLVVWLAVGGGMASSGAALIAVQWVAWRRRLGRHAGGASSARDEADVARP